MRLECPNGWTIDLMHIPDRKKPLIVLYYQNEYRGHAVVKDEDSFMEFAAWMMETWGVAGK